MKKFVVLLVIAFAVFVTLGIMGKLPNDLPVKIAPDSKFYFLEIWYEKLIIGFTFNLEERAEKYRIYAEKRLDEVDELMAEGKTELAQKRQELYKYFLNKAKDALNQMVQKAIKKGEEELIDQLNKKIEEIKN